MKTKITKGDLKNAQRAMSAGGDICECCLVYQAARRRGSKITSIGFTTFYTGKGGSKAVGYATGITRAIIQAQPAEWPKFVGREVEFPI